MTDLALVDAEFPAMQDYLLNRTAGIRFQDPLHRRAVDAIESIFAGEAGIPDAAVLVRQIARRLSGHRGTDVTIRVPATAPWYTSDRDWQRFGVSVVGSGDGTFALVVDDWQPSWLPPQGVRRPDDGALAGTSVGQRRIDRSVASDPFFESLFGYERYRSPGQRTAVRAAVTMRPGDCLICLLPTGSGKTEVALALALGGHALATTLIVVPTVSLAQDLERRIRDLGLVGHHGAFAWISSTDPDTRQRIRGSVIDGSQRILVTSPESLLGALHEVVLEAAAIGRIKGLVIDEAHLVRQWGTQFRPEFRMLSSLRTELVDLCEKQGWDAPRIILLSATLSDADLVELAKLFGTRGETILVAANELRPEPTYWIAEMSSVEERQRRVMEALDRLPRPLILYVTLPSKAKEWERLLRKRGYRRAAIITGATPGDDRAETLRDLRGDQGSTVADVVIATSAFGLGIDFGEIRSVIHACIPETVDRWYQEVGRAGRDGFASSALLVPAHGDDDEALFIASDIIVGWENAQERWEAMYTHRRQEIGRDGFLVNIDTPRNLFVQSGSYNRTYNIQVLHGLAVLGAITYKTLTAYELRTLGLLDESRGPKDQAWVRVEVEDPGIYDGAFWSSSWVEGRTRQLAGIADRSHRIHAVLRNDAQICQELVGAFEPGREIARMFGSAADTVRPLYGCGQCAECPGIDPEPVPASVPRVRWTTTTSTDPRLSRVLREVPTGPGLTLATVAAATKAEYEAEVVSTLRALIRAGVRHVIGLSSLRGEVLASYDRLPVFWSDEQTQPWNLPDVPTAVALAESEMELDPGWFVDRLRSSTSQRGGVTPVIVIGAADLRLRGAVRPIGAGASVVSAAVLRGRLAQ